MEVRVEEEDYGAFIQKFQLHPPPHSSSSSSDHPLPLQGLTFAVKDIFDISGYITGFGSPEWARTHAAATSTAPAVSAVIEAGATCVGKTIMDEMAFSVNGENKHYGTPTNPCTPDRVPGGSSSGSAVAVAGALVDFSLGTDTGGSVRVPAAYCGIFGFRPSHGVVSTNNVIPFAQSFDTIGWFARDPIILRLVGQVLLQVPSDETALPSHIVIADDCFQHLCSPHDKVSHIFTNSVKRIFGCHIIKQENIGDYICSTVPSLEKFVSESCEKQPSILRALSALFKANRALQRFEVKANHGDWVNTLKATLGPVVLERMSDITGTYEDMDSYKKLRREFQAAMDALLEDYGVLVIPTVAGPPPKLQMEAEKLNDYRKKAFSLISIAGLSRICQVTIPLGMHDNVPVSVSLLARHGKDHFLLNIAEALYDTLKEQANIAWELPFQDLA